MDINRSDFVGFDVQPDLYVREEKRDIFYPAGGLMGLCCLIGLDRKVICDTQRPNVR